MAIDPSIYRGVDTQFGMKLADLFNPNSIAQRQAAVDEQNMGNQLRQMQVMQGVQQMRRAPVLAQREDQQWQAQQAEAQRLKKELAQKEAMFAQATPEQQKMLRLGVPAKDVFIPEKPIAVIQEMRAAGISETSPEGQRILRQRLTRPEGGGQPYFTPVQTAQGVMSFNARTGRMEPINVGGNAVIGAVADPTLQGKIAAAKETGKGEAEYGMDVRKAVKKSDQLLSMAGEAEKLLKKSPTGSGVGAAVDWAGRQVGVTSESAKTAADLEAISGWMVSNVPRMEGPQSNFDVQNYQTMAAKVGDRTVPVAERLSALKTLTGLQEKYKAINQDSISAPQKPVASDDDAEAIAWAQANPNDPRAAKIMSMHGR